jgi:two-component system, NtrC family, nitrogen regulation sensor histidine kinase NtrY
MLAVVVTVIVSLIPQNENKDPQARIHEAENKLISMQNEVVETLGKISQLSDEKIISNYFLNTGSEKQGFSFYVLNDNSLQYWSDNEPAITDSMLGKIQNGEFIHLSNGDFLANTLNAGNKKFIGLILIKHSYEYENKYLINKFNPALGIGDDFSVSDTGDTLHLPGNIPAYILKHDPDANVTPDALITWLYFFIAFIVILSIYFFIRHFSKSLFLTFIFISVVVAFRTFMIYVKVPSAFYDQGIFSPTYYASSFYFNSLGDMLLNAALFLVFSLGLLKSINASGSKKIILFLFWLSSALAIHLLIRGLVINSKISFELSSPSDINLYSILAFASISILLICFLLITAALMKNFSGYALNVRHIWMGISICAIYSATTLTGMNLEKEHETRKLIAQKAEMRQDHVAEYLFREQEEKIISDPDVLAIIHSEKNVNEQLSTYISQKYFNGYLSKFELNVQYFNGVNQTDTDVNFEFYQKQAREGRTTYSKRLFFLNNETGQTPYLAILPLNDANHNHKLVLLMNARFLHSAKGFPELFMVGRYQDNSPSDDYSIARYSGQSLIYEYGNYIYPLTSRDFLHTEDDYFFDLNGYSHLIHRLNDNSFLIVSKQKGNFLGVLTLFSWMFACMSMLAFLIFIISGILGEEPSWQWNLTRKVQASVIFLVVMTFVLVGSGTVYYIKSKYINDQNKSISDQVNALWFMVGENLVSSPPEEISDTSDLRKQLDRLVSNTNIDFNIFNGEGKKVYSSQPKIFDKGIVSSRMNTEAFFTIKEKGITQFIHPERAGMLKFIAAYAPFTDRSGNIIAFINLPYFEKQNELNKDVSVFLSALVNIYVLLFALAVFVTIFISSRITKPLLLIQEKMSGIKLGVTNEKIAYGETDEIGQLVHEYNRMIDELSVSAEKLARSERESAWREMARQVAHEIKNPLTPMKLSVQHLHRTFKDKGFGDEPLVDRITQTLIQQIDTLSNIATAFSNFAQMPSPVPVKVELKELLEQVVQLYVEEIEIVIHASNESFFVTADKDQLVGIFSNLLKNAFQSIPNDRKGRIDISLRRDSGGITIEIADNGIGIPEDQRDKIFIPNFTTKSSGMGLGLAIVRNIVEEAAGKIWFSSVYGKGTSFFVSLPEAG